MSPEYLIPLTVMVWILTKNSISVGNFEIFKPLSLQRWQNDSVTLKCSPFEKVQCWFMWHSVFFYYDNGMITYNIDFKLANYFLN